MKKYSSISGKMGRKKMDQEQPSIPGLNPNSIISYLCLDTLGAYTDNDGNILPGTTRSGKLVITDVDPELLSASPQHRKMQEILKLKQEDILYNDEMIPISRETADRICPLTTIYFFYKGGLQDWIDPMNQYNFDDSDEQLIELALNTIMEHDIEGAVFAVNKLDVHLLWSSYRDSVFEAEEKGIVSDWIGFPTNTPEKEVIAWFVQNFGCCIQHNAVEFLL